MEVAAALVGEFTLRVTGEPRELADIAAEVQDAVTLTLMEFGVVEVLSVRVEGVEGDSSVPMPSSAQRSFDDVEVQSPPHDMRVEDVVEAALSPYLADSVDSVGRPRTPAEELVAILFEQKAKANGSSGVSGRDG